MLNYIYIFTDIICSTVVFMSHRVSRAIRRRAFAAGDAESQPLVVAEETRGQLLAWAAGARLHVVGQATAASLPREVVVFWPERRRGDGVLWLYHTLP